MAVDVGNSSNRLLEAYDSKHHNKFRAVHLDPERMLLKDDMFNAAMGQASQAENDKQLIQDWLAVVDSCDKRWSPETVKLVNELNKCIPEPSSALWLQALANEVELELLVKDIDLSNISISALLPLLPVFAAHAPEFAARLIAAMPASVSHDQVNAAVQHTVQRDKRANPESNIGYVAEVEKLKQQQAKQPAYKRFFKGCAKRFLKAIPIVGTMLADKAFPDATQVQKPSTWKQVVKSIPGVGWLLDWAGVLDQPTQSAVVERALAQQPEQPQVVDTADTFDTSTEGVTDEPHLDQIKRNLQSAFDAANNPEPSPEGNSPEIKQAKEEKEGQVVAAPFEEKSKAPLTAELKSDLLAAAKKYNAEAQRRWQEAKQRPVLDDAIKKDLQVEAKQYAERVTRRADNSNSFRQHEANLEQKMQAYYGEYAAWLSAMPHMTDKAVQQRIADLDRFPLRARVDERESKNENKGEEWLYGYLDMLGFLSRQDLLQGELTEKQQKFITENYETWLARMPQQPHTGLYREYAQQRDAADRDKMRSSEFKVEETKDELAGILLDDEKRDEKREELEILEEFKDKDIEPLELNETNLQALPKYISKYVTQPEDSLADVSSIEPAFLDPSSVGGISSATSQNASAHLLAKSRASGSATTSTMHDHSGGVEAAFLENLSTTQSSFGRDLSRDVEPAFLGGSSAANTSVEASFGSPNFLNATDASSQADFSTVSPAFMTTPAESERSYAATPDVSVDFGDVMTTPPSVDGSPNSKQTPSSAGSPDFAAVSFGSVSSREGSALRVLDTNSPERLVHRRRSGGKDSPVRKLNFGDDGNNENAIPSLSASKVAMFGKTQQPAAQASFDSQDLSLISLTS